jgi:hypothetical protein
MVEPESEMLLPKAAAVPEIGWIVQEIPAKLPEQHEGRVTLADSVQGELVSNVCPETGMPRTIKMGTQEETIVKGVDVEARPPCQLATSRESVWDPRDMEDGNPYHSDWEDCTVLPSKLQITDENARPTEPRELRPSAKTPVVQLHNCCGISMTGTGMIRFCNVTATDELA